MSDNPFGERNPFEELPSENPYAAPTSLDSSPATGNPVLAPGIVLLVLSSIFMLFLLATLPGQFIRMSEVDTSTPAGMGEVSGGIVTLIAWLAMTLAILVGSICMIRMKGYSGALTAACAACVPICSPFFLLGIPFGIWALIMLLRKDLRARFQ